MLTLSERIRRVLEAPASSKFVDLVLLAGLDPKKHFRDMNLDGLDLSDQDLSNFDFSGSSLEGCNFQNSIWPTTSGVISEVQTGEDTQEDIEGFTPAILKLLEAGGTFRASLEEYLKRYGFLSGLRVLRAQFVRKPTNISLTISVMSKLIPVTVLERGARVTIPFLATMPPIPPGATRKFLYEQVKQHLGNRGQLDMIASGYTAGSSFLGALATFHLHSALGEAGSSQRDFVAQRLVDGPLWGSTNSVVDPDDFVWLFELFGDGWQKGETFADADLSCLVGLARSQQQILDVIRQLAKAQQSLSPSFLRSAAEAIIQLSKAENSSTRVDETEVEKSLLNFYRTSVHDQTA